MFKRNPQFIVYLNSDGNLPPISIHEKKFVIGRKPTHPVSIPDASISRDHLEVIVQDGQIYVMDLETSNGTRVDGILIPGNIPTPYRPGQSLYLGHSNVSITIELFEDQKGKTKSAPTTPRVAVTNTSQTFAQEKKIYSPQPAMVTHHHHEEDDQSPSVAQSSKKPDVIKQNTRGIQTVQTSQSAHRNIPHAPANEPSSAAPHHNEATSPLGAQKPSQELKSQELPPNDLEALKQSVAVLMVQIDHLKAQVIKHQTDKIATEALYKQESTRLEKIQEELRSEEHKQRTIRQDLEIKQNLLKETEEKHKMLVLSNQSLVEDTKAALEKARSREVELNVLIEQARKDHQEAIDFAKNHRADAESYSTQMRTDAERYSNQLRTEAEVYAKDTREEAEKYSKSVRDEAETYSKTTREEADEWATRLRSSTDAEVRKKIDSLQEETNKIFAEREQTYLELKARQETQLEDIKKAESTKIKNVQNLDATFKKRTEELEETYRTRKDQVERDFYEKREILERELSQRRTSMERELLERREALEKEANDRRSQIESDAQELRSIRDREYKELKTQQDAYLIDVRTREEDRLKGIVDESRKVIKEQFSIKNENINKAFNDYFEEQIKLAPTESREQLPKLQQDLQKILREALTEEFSGEDKQIKQLFEYDPKHQKKHKTFWKRFAVTAAIIVTVGGYLVNNPKQVTESAITFSETVNTIDQENKKVQAEYLNKIKEQSVYHPDQTPSFKDTYTDNVLFTSRYVEFENDEQYKSQWIVAIKEYLTQEAKIQDDKADELISKEGALINSLSGEVATIDARQADKGIARMREIEIPFIVLLTQSMNDEIRKGYQEKKQAFYERFINDPAKFRGPAQSK